MTATREQQLEREAARLVREMEEAVEPYDEYRLAALTERLVAVGAEHARLAAARQYEAAKARVTGRPAEHEAAQGYREMMKEAAQYHTDGHVVAAAGQYGYL